MREKNFERCSLFAGLIIGILAGFAIACLFIVPIESDIIDNIYIGKYVGYDPGYWIQVYIDANNDLQALDIANKVVDSDSDLVYGFRAWRKERIVQSVRFMERVKSKLGGIQ